MKCWKCNLDLEDPPLGKLSFRALCDHCSAWLHCCKNCKNYKPGLPNDCLVPGTEYIADREGSNFCEDFKLLGLGSQKSGDLNRAAQKLFKDEEDHPKLHPKGFTSLFDEDGE